MTHPFIFLNWLLEKVRFGLSTDMLAHHGFFQHVTHTWLVMAFLAAIGWLATRRADMVPTGLQNLVEAILVELRRMARETMGSRGVVYFPLIATLALFLLVSNLLGLIPGFAPPTASLNTNLALALTVFAMTHIIGFREHGIRYLKHFTGPIWWLVPLLLPIEIIGHLARPLSLSLRLFGNMYGHEIILMIFFTLVPLLLPIPMMIMGIFVAFIQTFVFTLLSMIYIAGALEEAH
ncbi:MULTISPECIES: F0F1 ATP synthase subunit A [Syntrophotalea]|jgi:F-type H+-transporting ATPase subunit a|uniref:ATP synthase subunit a n=1 Tax=Syntrophotalea acetylenica TaxID=29542 RepID=A0A1L3GHE2_SYNAC|nr:F0F1 ATP synthase subunit A [Syntrophotalea acetylenica]APG25309.1 ATP synthase F0 subunit A [Syntrophotalea acetylenica]APG43378.1 F0F1 ATP synthase subunit A [Syntrophotalea acetylenica]MDY0263062.1 F0F1 ATP synthase subunit A [Syntrophotalea acetylenica]